MKKRSIWRGYLAFAHDVCAAAVAWAALYWLRFNLDVKGAFFAEMAWSLAWILPLQATIFLSLGLYRGLWRFASIMDLQRIVLAAFLGAILVPLVLVMLQMQTVVPRSVLVFYPIVLIFLMAGSRFAYRIWKEHRLYSPLEALGEPVLIIGAGEAGAHLAKDLARSRQWRVVGLLDDDRAKQGRLLRNVSVLGPISELAAWSERFGVHKVIIALPSSNHVVRRRVAELCAAAGVEALTVPSYEDLISGRSALTTIRNVELDDLLGRDPVVLDSAGLGEWLGNRVVMVTGAGGSLARSSRGRSRDSVLRGSCFSIFRRPHSTKSRPSWAMRSRSCRLRLSSATSSMRHSWTKCSHANGPVSSSTPGLTSTCR